MQFSQWLQYQSLYNKKRIFYPAMSDPTVCFSVLSFQCHDKSQDKQIEINCVRKYKDKISLRSGSLLSVGKTWLGWHSYCRPS